MRILNIVFIAWSEERVAYIVGIAGIANTLNMGTLYVSAPTPSGPSLLSSLFSGRVTSAEAQ